MAVKFQRRSDNTVGTIPQDVIVCRRIAAAGDAIDQNLFIADTDYEVVGVQAVWGVASSSGTLQIEKCTGTTAPGSGTDLLSSTINTAGTANTVASGSLTTTVASKRLTSGDRLALDFGGTVTNLVNLVVVVRLKRLQAANSAY